MSEQPCAIIYTGELTDAPGRWEQWTETVVPRVRGGWSLRIRSTDFFGRGPVETTTLRFADTDALVEYLRERDLEDAPRRRIGPRMSELDDFAQSIGRQDVVNAIEEFRRPPRAKPARLLAIDGTISVGSFPNGRSRALYLRVRTDRGRAIMSRPRPTDRMATCWPGDSPYFRQPFRVRLSAALRKAATEAFADAATDHAVN